MSVNCDLLESLESEVRKLEAMAEPFGGIAVAHLLRDAKDRIVMLERALARYGERGRMAWCPEPAMQFVIDVALEHRHPDPDA